MKRKTFITIFQMMILIILSSCKELQLMGSVTGEPPGNVQIPGEGPLTSAENLGPTVSEAHSENEAIEIGLLAGIIKPLPWTSMEWNLFSWSKENKNQEIKSEYNEVVNYYNGAIKNLDVDKMNTAIDKIRALREKIDNQWGNDTDKENFVRLFNEEADFYITGIKEYLGE